MGKQLNVTDEHLLNYLDGTLNPQERNAIEQLLEADQQVALRLDALRSIHDYLLTSGADEPSKNFTQRVMERLQYPATSGYSPRNGILLLTGVLIAVGIAAVLLASGVFDTTTTLDLNQLVVPNKYLDENLPSISINGKLIVNLIILVNIALAFIVLDRAVLKPWFKRRRELNLL